MNIMSDVFDILRLRWQWEDLVQDFKIDPERKHGTIDNIQWFIDHGITNNRFRRGFKAAVGVAQEIMDLYNENSNLSGVRRKEI